MSSDEETSYFTASDEGDDEIIEVDERKVKESDEDYGDEEDNHDNNELRKELEEMQWKNVFAKRKRKRKDIITTPMGLTFSPIGILDCFNQFFTNEVREVLVKYTNLKGELLPSLFLYFALSLSLSIGKI